MVYKLKRKSFSGKCLKIMEAMVNIVQISKSSRRLLPPITTLLGLKQGDNLSPILLDILFDDVEEIFDDSCNQLITCFMRMIWQPYHFQVKDSRIP